MGTHPFRVIVIRDLGVGVPTHPRKQATQAGLAKALQGEGGSCFMIAAGSGVAPAVSMAVLRIVSQVPA